MYVRVDGTFNGSHVLGVAVSLGVDVSRISQTNMEMLIDVVDKCFTNWCSSRTEYLGRSDAFFRRLQQQLLLQCWMLTTTTTNIIIINIPTSEKAQITCLYAYIRAKKLSQFTKLCKGDMSQHSKMAKMVSESQDPPLYLTLITLTTVSALPCCAVISVIIPNNTN